MINFDELEQLIAFAKHGTLVKAADTLHISQPTITRTMKNIEDCFGVKLFERGKNRIRLNDTGKIAVEHAEKVLESARQMMTTVREYDKSLRTNVSYHLISGKDDSILDAITSDKNITAVLLRQ